MSLSLDKYGVVCCNISSIILKSSMIPLFLVHDEFLPLFSSQKSFSSLFFLIPFSLLSSVLTFQGPIRFPVFHPLQQNFLPLQIGKASYLCKFLFYEYEKEVFLMSWNVLSSTSIPFECLLHIIRMMIYINPYSCLWLYRHIYCLVCLFVCLLRFLHIWMGMSFVEINAHPNAQFIVTVFHYPCLLSTSKKNSISSKLNGRNNESFFLFFLYIKLFLSWGYMDNINIRKSKNEQKKISKIPIELLSIIDELLSMSNVFQCSSNIPPYPSVQFPAMLYVCVLECPSNSLKIPYGVRICLVRT